MDEPIEEDQLAKAAGHGPEEEDQLPGAAGQGPVEGEQLPGAARQEPMEDDQPMQDQQRMEDEQERTEGDGPLIHLNPLPSQPGPNLIVAVGISLSSPCPPTRV